MTHFMMTDYDTDAKIITDNLVSGDGKNQASVRMQSFITDYQILLSIYFSHSLN